jgi:hypothetical protein
MNKAINLLIRLPFAIGSSAIELAMAIAEKQNSCKHEVHF